MSAVSRAISVTGAGAAAAFARTRAWLRALGASVADAWRRASPVAAERWHGGTPRPRRGGVAGYVEGLSMLWQRLRWDVALRRCVIIGGWLLLVGLPLPWSVAAVALFLWVLMPR